jgi:benzoylformate decarboxylase
MRPVEAMLAILRDEGVTTVFGNPGTSELPFTDALSRVDDIDYVLGVHEGPLVAMAAGYARATRRTAFVSLHIAAGLANGLVGLLNASRSRTPLVVTAGQQDRRHLASDPMLSGDLIGLAKAAVKQTFDVQHAHDLPIMLRRAFAAAAAPPAGPVFLSIPMDLLAEDTDVLVPRKSTVVGLPAAGGLAEAADILCAAHRPAIVAGDGVGRDGAVADLVVLAETLGATVYHQPMHDEVDFPTSHPLHAGILPPTNAGIRSRLAGHDVVFIVGTHAFMAHHYTPGPAIPPATEVLQLDTDAAELGRNFPVRLGLLGALGPSLRELADHIGHFPTARTRIAFARKETLARESCIDRKARAAAGPAPLDPYGAVGAIAAGLPSDAVVVEEAITTGVLLRDVLLLDRPGALVHTVGGGLGAGIGMAVGHRMGAPDHPTIAVLGDGCAMFGLQGLWTAARYRVPVTFLVMNNGEYRTLKETLTGWGSTGPYVGLDIGHLDFTHAAEFFGIDTVRVTDTDHLREVVAKSAIADGPLLVDVPITGHDGRNP